MAKRRDQLDQATHFLCRSDAVLAGVIQAVGTCQLPLRRNRFAMLVRSIISQQISTAAARTIHKRLEDLLDPHPIAAEHLVRLRPTQLRKVGLSRQKVAYLKDLAGKTDSGEIRFSRFGRMSDDAVIEELIQVKGIGRWTAEMLLIFSLGRLDVLPCDDLGIQKAIRQLYGLESMPNKQQCYTIAAPWRPYASVASWYCWRSLELK